MHQRQAEVAARDLGYGAGGGLQDAQAVAMPGCCVGFVNADRGRSPPPAGQKNSPVRVERGCVCLLACIIPDFR